MPTLTVTKNYDDGNVLTESNLDDIKTSIETFVNSTKLDSDNIQTGGIITANYAANSVDAAALATDAVTTAKILDANVTTAKIADSNITTAKIANSNVTAAKIETSVNLPGSGVQVNSKRVITSNTNASANLEIVRGTIAGDGSISLGEGFTVNHSGTGTYVLTFTTPFSAAPVVVGSSVNTGGNTFAQSSASASSVSIGIFSPSGATDAAFSFIAIGIRT